MAWPEKTASGIWRVREATRTEGKKRTVDIIKDLGIGDQGEKLAASACVDYEKAKRQGYVWKPLSQHVLADIRAYLKAKALGFDPNEPARDCLDALDKCLTAKKRSPATKSKYRGHVEEYLDVTKAKVLDDMTVDSVNAWREGMENGTLTYGRKEGGNRYRYSETTVSIRLNDLRVFCNYCVFRGWMTSDPANKSKPLNPFAQIAIADPKGTKRYLTRGEAARLLRHARQDKIKAGGNKPISDEVRTAVISAALKNPSDGKWTAKRMLAKQGIEVGIGTVDWIWLRNGLTSERQRKKAAGRPIVPAVTMIQNVNVNRRLRYWLHFDLYTGLREGEFRRARCEDITTTYVVNPNGGKPELVYGLQIFEPSKGSDNKMRIVWLPPNLVRIHGIAKKFGTKGLLFSVLGKSGFAKARRLAARRAGLGRVRFHDLRHSFARNFLLSGTGKLPQLQQALGHSRLSTTGIYSNFAHTDGAAAAKSYRVK